MSAIARVLGPGTLTSSVGSSTLVHMALYPYLLNSLQVPPLGRRSDIAPAWGASSPHWPSPRHSDC